MYDRYVIYYVLYSTVHCDIQNENKILRHSKYILYIKNGMLISHPDNQVEITQHKQSLINFNYRFHHGGVIKSKQ